MAQDGRSQDSGLKEILWVGWKETSPAGLIDTMAGTADALNGGRDGERGLDQYHFVERADVDPEFERVGCNDRSQMPRFEPSLYLCPDFQ